MTDIGLMRAEVQAEYLLVKGFPIWIAEKNCPSLPAIDCESVHFAADTPDLRCSYQAKTQPEHKAPSYEALQTITVVLAPLPISISAL
ncbi:MAG: hypothetical protein GWN58_18910 [Anaerolineae bacterium]|nr:hypothetical protein [Anaerolineae bacterium]